MYDSSDAVRAAIEKDRLNVMKAKERWQQATDYVSTDNLFYSVDRSLSGLGRTHFINFSKSA